MLWENWPQKIQTKSSRMWSRLTHVLYDTSTQLSVPVTLKQMKREFLTGRLTKVIYLKWPEHTFSNSEVHMKVGADFPLYFHIYVLVVKWSVIAKISLQSHQLCGFFGNRIFLQTQRTCCLSRTMNTIRTGDSVMGTIIACFITRSANITGSLLDSERSRRQGW